MKRILTAIIILASLFITTCDNIALGVALNLKGPVVEITGPVSAGKSDPAVGTLFNFSGTASSDSTVTRMSITLTYFNRAANRMVVMGREWKYEGGIWQIREGSNLPWNSYSSNIYSLELAQYPVEDPSWKLQDKVVHWNLPVYMNRMEKGQYFVSVQAWDSAGLSDSNSSKRLKVEFNNENPTIKIDSPLLKDGEGPLNAPIPPDYFSEAYRFDPFGSPRQTYDNRRNFTNKFSDFRWTTEQNVALDKLTIEITNEHNLDIADVRKKTYYKGVFDFTDPAFDGTDFTYKGIGKGANIGDNNSIPPIGTNLPDSSYIRVGNEIILGQAPYTDDFALLPKDRITPLQIVTTIVDETGLKEYKSKGWFMYLPDSDKPYADISFGYKVKQGQSAPLDAPDRAVILRGNTYKIYFYDDKEGVKMAKWTLTKLMDNSLETDTSISTLPKTDTITFTDNPTYYSYDFEADYNYVIGRYKLEIEVTDNANIKGDIYTAYFTIASNTVPSILDWNSDLALPDGGAHATTRWGSRNGDINFWGTAAVEDRQDCDGNHSVKIDRVTVVLINYDNDEVQGMRSEIDFTDTSYAGWNLGMTAGTNGFTDTRGNKIWEIPSSAIEFQTYSQGNNGNGHREEWKFSKTLNWFKDLNGDVSTKNRRLIVRAVSRGALNKEYYGTRFITIKGDDTPPTLDINQITLETRADANSAFGGQGRTWTWNFNTLNETLQAITPNTRIRLTGTWGDDSALNWDSSTGRQMPQGLFKYAANPSDRDVIVEWEGSVSHNKLTRKLASFTTSNTWETEWFVLTEPNTDPNITFTMRLEDLAGNQITKQRSITVETDTPTLSRVSSDMANGSYGPNSGYLEIYLGFNKAIYLDVSPGSGASMTTEPSLTLSNGAKATYYGGLGQITVNSSTGNATVTSPGSEKIVFRYTVATGDTEVTKLNVTGINYGTATKNKWKSVENSEALIPDYVFSSSNAMSFAMQKNIAVDRTPPAISSITTSAATNKYYGIGQEIYFTVTFNEDIDLLPNPTASITLYPSTFNKTANLVGKTGPRSVQFLYTVEKGHDTNGGRITVNSVSGFNYIKDKAANTLISSPSIGTLGDLGTTNIYVDTTPPARPTITSSTANGATAYNNVNISVGAIESGARWEYNTDYTEGITTGWVTGTNTTITFDRNGSYKVAVRQFDNANPENASPVSDVYSFTINKGDILTKITSSNNNGSYGYGATGKGTINIDIELRVPVWFTGTRANAYVTLNTTGGGANANRATLSTSATAAVSNTKKLTFTYEIPDGVATPESQYLNVTGIAFTGDANVSDAASGGTNLNSSFTSYNVSNFASENQLNKQKEIVILSGIPATNNNTLGTSSTGTNSLWFNGTQLGIKFNRDIYRGTTTKKIRIRQVATNYRIPAVLTEQRYSDLFLGRDSMFSDNDDITGLAGILAGGTDSARAKSWELLGAALYEKGSNGATAGTGTGTPLSPDTSTKYVLIFNVDTAAAGTTNVTIPSGIAASGTTITMANLANLFRAAEALTFGVNDPSISISNSNNIGTITVGLTTNPLPVKGASYEWTFPNGFITDILSRRNGGTGDGADPISSTNTERLLVYTNGYTNGIGGTGLTNLTTESPVIRIDKGDDNTYFAMDANGNLSNTTDYTTTRQARQKLVTQVKMDCRTPGATITYATRTASDNVRRLIFRNGGTIPGTNNINLLPNIGSMQNENDAAAGRTSWENLRMRPQSGVNGVGDNSPITGVNWTGLGLNYYTAVTSATWTAGSTLPFTIGTVNYNDGGQEINIRATAAATNMSNSDMSYEAAYRSVLVFCNAYISADKNSWANDGLSIGGNNIRVWVRGSNTSQGDPTIPDFPIARDASLYKKVKLMTPISPPTIGTYAESTVLNDGNVATASTEGRDLWFWVTWRINVPAFIDLQVAGLSTSGTHAPAGNTIRKYYMTYIPSVEHYAVHPGRTTIMEARNSYNNQWDGEHGGLALTDTTSPLPQSDND